MIEVNLVGRTRRDCYTARALIDTGAPVSLIHDDFARNILLLDPSGDTRAIDVPHAGGAGTQELANSYEISFAVVDNRGDECVLLRDRLTMAGLSHIPQLEAPGRKHPPPIKVLLGMDFLSKVNFGYRSGETETAFWLQALPKR